ncbi:MAG: hypothetical protein M0Z96_02855 [Actinomycetota bacterium]|nr:hypothetical protein [Actinomycetota bacterium]
MSGQFQGVSQHRPRRFEVGVARLELFLNSLELARNRALLVPQQIDRDRSRIVGIEQLLALGAKFDEKYLHPLAILLRCFRRPIEVAKHKFFDVVAQFG